MWLLTQRSITGFIEPTHNIPQLENEIQQLDAEKPVSLVVDLTRGKLSSNLPSISDIPQWNSFSIGRIREATQVGLPTSGHILSHNIDEIQQTLADTDTSHVLILDDTSFSGTTSLIVENLIKNAFPERTIEFSHGFLIVNTGMLGPQNGALTQLQENGSQVVRGFEMETPRDDGWHFFDIVDQDSIENHFLVVREMLRILELPNFEQLAGALLSNEEILKIMFPQLIAADELHDQQRTGHFLTGKKINGGFHVRNPQLLPNIIGQNHILKPNEWKASQDEVFSLLVHINQLLQTGA